MEESNNKKRVTFFGANEEISRSGETGKKLNDILKRLYVEISNLNKSLKDKEEIIDRKEDIIRNLEKELAIAKRNVDLLQTENQRLKKSNQSKIHAIKRIKDSSNQKPKDNKIKVQEPEPVEVNLKEDKRPIGNDRKLAVITSFFNPANYVNIRHNYLQFSREIKKHADLFPIELSFNGEFFIEDENVIRINGNEENVLWQKERLLSIVLDNLPEEYTNVAWLDCDILFENQNWAEEINSKLEEYKVVQVYETAKRLDENGEIGLTSTGIIKKNEEDGKIHDDIRGTTGFGWAIRREVIDEIKFIDTQIIGGADAIMYLSFYGIQGTRIHGHMGKEWQLAIKEWCDRAFNVVNGSVGYISGSIIHLYHGKPTKRGYGDRHDVLREYKFDPNKHLELTPDGLWRFTSTELNDKLKKYFVSREEDDNILKVNEYFDKVYVLNLDRRPDRLEKVTKELNSFGIEFDRFSAVDGNNISDEEYDFSKFVSGKGMIENKYALACLRSHIEIIKDAKKNNYERVLIFEDDVYLDPNFEVHLQNIKKIPNWGLIYFGATQYGWNVEFIEDFYFSRQSLGTFAYAIDSSVYDQILEADKESLAVDTVLSKVQSKNYGRCYTYYPNICIPDVTDSDIRGPRDQRKHGEIMRWNWAENGLDNGKRRS